MLAAYRVGHVICMYIQHSSRLSRCLWFYGGLVQEIFTWLIVIPQLALFV